MALAVDWGILRREALAIFGGGSVCFVRCYHIGGSENATKLRYALFSNSSGKKISLGLPVSCAEDLWLLRRV